ncbi:hypothetical protein MAJ_09991, partial [Metarhizium majus ARSEF 297]
MQYPLVLVAAFATASMAAPTAPPASAQSKDEMPTEVCPRNQLVIIGMGGYDLSREKCLPLRKECEKRNITELAELKKCITDARISQIQELQKAAQGTQSRDEMPTEVCPKDQLVFIGNVGYDLPREKCLPLRKECTQRNITEPAELKKCITDARISEIQGHQEAAQGTKREA